MRETKTNKNGKWCRREKRIEKNSKQKEKRKNWLKIIEWERLREK